MGAKKTSQVEILCENLVKLLKNRQQQLEFLLEERKLLEDIIKTQQERWISDVCLCKDQIVQMEDSLTKKDLAYSLLESKLALMSALKHREASLLKLKLEQTEDDLKDFKAGFEYISPMLQKNSPIINKEKEDGRQSYLKSSDSKKLASEIKKLKLENEKLSSEKSSEISSLLKEKTFMWNQYNKLESDLANKLKSKEAEINLANDKIAELLASVEQLQSSINQKDELIENLRYKLAEMEADRDKQKEEISKLTGELKSIKESSSPKFTPLLREHVDAEIKCLTRGGKSSLLRGSNIIMKKELPSSKSAVPLKDDEKGSRSLKRKKFVDELNVFETPKLFSNSFKVPKLK